MFKIGDRVVSLPGCMDNAGIADCQNDGDVGTIDFVESHHSILVIFDSGTHPSGTTWWVNGRFIAHDKDMEE